MPSQPVTVRLDPRRLEQLKAIAHAEDITVADVVTQIIRTKVKQGVIAATIPGVTVDAIDGGVSIDLGAGYSAAYGKASADEVVNSIRSVAKGGSSIVSLDHHYAVVRQGSGIKIAAPFPGPEVSFPVTLAEDLADLIQETAQ